MYHEFWVTKYHELEVRNIESFWNRIGHWIW
ncbi:hypothetical protein C7459_11624 [Tumebacillus permanentifrigoris]|uniref:Uncharacterized protein n=1 Tax=Tumebacillus permanentifrigoris TaxID=378543 RepID=A0A316D4N2_9BACL|nr:hypothetical protein C7459_11624 [Tumebacillus permanentifrigoris]